MKTHKITDPKLNEMLTMLDAKAPVTGWDLPEEIDAQFLILKSCIDSLYLLAEQGMTVQEAAKDGYILALDHQARQLKGLFSKYVDAVAHVNIDLMHLQKISADEA